MVVVLIRHHSPFIIFTQNFQLQRSAKKQQVHNSEHMIDDNVYCLYC